MELIIGPSLALLASMFFTVVSHKKTDTEVAELTIKVEKLAGKVVGMSKVTDIRLSEVEKENLEKTMKILVPIATAVKKLNQTVGL